MTSLCGKPPSRVSVAIMSSFMACKAERSSMTASIRSSRPHSDIQESWAFLALSMHASTSSGQLEANSLITCPVRGFTDLTAMKSH
ncbi:MAG: hypothetical protein A4E29_00236 [Methanomassiliicoccales archaeon PtaB.Bin134]|nr:MAG: hypothetical protein A4E29_00236 [Methanomassiliicoccales archaeon PtaB.Bin134]